MFPSLETKAPFVIKVYDKYFNVSEDGLSDKEDDNYYYSKIKSIQLEEGQRTLQRNVIGIVARMFFNAYSGNSKDPDQLIITLENGGTEVRYFQQWATKEHIKAIELISSKIKYKR
ncbi:MAG: hypothetical protein V4608_16015 [Bacteroidota bacterium]